jgi:DNA-binding transcriptional ArsR family regulator
LRRDTLLANPTRRAILARLAEGEATVNELAEPFNMSLPAISKHIKVLERAGLITQGQKAQYRPCTIEGAPLQEISNWTEPYRHSKGGMGQKALACPLLKWSCASVASA